MTGRSHFPSLSSLSPSQNCLSQDAVIVSCDCSLTTYKIMIVVLLFPNHKMLEMFCHFVLLHRSNTVPDPDLEIRGEGLVSPQFFFGPLGMTVQSGSATATQPCPKGFLVAIPSTSNIILYYRCHFLNITTVLKFGQCYMQLNMKNQPRNLCESDMQKYF